MYSNWLNFPNTGHFFLIGQVHPATQHKAVPQHGVDHCVILTYTIINWRVQRNNNFCRFFFRASRKKKKDIHVLVYSTIPYCRRKAQGESSTSAGFKLGCQTSFSHFPVLRRTPYPLICGRSY